MTLPGKVRVWDLPTRLFHWSLAAAVAAAYATGETGGTWLLWHGRLGLVIVGLLAFRLAWGVFGSTYARFAAFFPTPAKIRAYLAGEWQGLGHNPLGALSVLSLLALLLLQAGSGLFAYNDDIGYEGPLAALVASGISGLATAFHHKVFDLLLGLVALHVGAIVFYLRIRKDNLVKPMLTGEKESERGKAAQGGGLAAFMLALILALGAAWGASGTWIAQPPPPPPSAAPAW